MIRAARRPLRRICFVMPFHIAEMRGGGAEVQAWLLAKELARRGYEVSYVAQSVAGREGTVTREDGVALHWLPYREHLRWLSGPAWYRALKAIDPDLVVQRMSSEVTGVVGVYARLHRAGFSWICTGDATPRRWLFVGRQVAANRAKAPGVVKGAVFLADAIVRDLLRQLGLKYATHAFTQNELQGRRLRETFGLDSLRLPSGHEPPAQVIPLEERRRAGPVLWAGTLGAGKRPRLFVELARCLPARRFVMVGGHADAATVAAAVADLPPNLAWRGKLPFDATLGWFDRAAIVVNTSPPDGEGFPNTFVQAWLRGVPVASLGVDPDGIVAEHGLGLVATDVDELAHRLGALLDDPAAYAALSDRVARFARERYTVARVADAFLEAVR